MFVCCLCLYSVYLHVYMLNCLLSCLYLCESQRQNVLFLLLKFCLVGMIVMLLCVRLIISVERAFLIIFTCMM